MCLYKLLLIQELRDACLVNAYLAYQGCVFYVSSHHPQLK